MKNIKTYIAALKNMHLFILVLMTICISESSVMANSCSKKDVAPLLNKLFSSLGHDCNVYSSLFAEDAKYFHQHDGFKKSSELLRNCQNYAAFCPGNECRFLQSGDAKLIARGSSCHVLVPYLWSEIPANNRAKENLEPHTGFEYVVLNPGNESEVGYSIKYFAELESSYSVAFNWAKPADTSAVVAESTLKLLSLKNSASKGECNNPIAPVLTKYFDDKSGSGNIWRQQGDAIVLAAGGVCHVVVPYSAQVGAKLKTGHFVFTLQPSVVNNYLVTDAVEFPSALL
ncbi:MAG: hypothetical protein ACXVCY_06095 [Pseudobdellovibrionaceae bacterium]